MIDGFKIFYRLPDFEAWKRSVKIEMFTLLDLDTGAAKGKIRPLDEGSQQTIIYTGNFQTYQITVKETIKTLNNSNTLVSFFLIIAGSLHKNHFSGANYLPFTWYDILAEIEQIETNLGIQANLLQLVNLEIGVNVNLPFPVFPFLQKNLISYKGYSFNRYNPNKNGVCLGYFCPLTQYSVKLYDKGKQFDLPDHILRFELRYIKMHTLTHRGIKHLSDLKNWGRVNNSLDLLSATWDNVLLYDNSIDLKNSKLKQLERELLEAGSNPKFWERLKDVSKREFNYKRSKFRELVFKHGAGWHDKIKGLIHLEWQNLSKNCPNLPSVPTMELDKLTVKVKGQNQQIQGSSVLERCCLSCGRDISQQGRWSKFCSAKFAGGAAAHHCRNKDSNPRNNFKRRIERIKRKGVLFDVLPYCIVKNNKEQANGI